MKNHRKTYSELTPVEKIGICTALDLLISDLSQRLGACPEAIAAKAFYRLQRHTAWGRNATETQKAASYRHWNGVCQRPDCTDKRPASRAELTFHHLVRGVPRQHEPANLVPHHLRCHDAEHRAVRRSLLTGSPEKQRTKKPTK